jgi:hypothetical protein
MIERVIVRPVKTGTPFILMFAPIEEGSLVMLASVAEAPACWRRGVAITWL